jgi:membrane-bound lytic murein transglycosylase B
VTKLPARWFCLLTTLCSAITFAKESSPSIASHPLADDFIAEMVSRHGFESDYLQSLLSDARLRPSVIERMTRPAEGLPWHAYRKIFLGRKRVEAGAEFWNRHATLLATAEARYGVAAEIIVAIIGVETFYGRQTGSDPVLESLATLAFDYPPRATFFRGELEQVLLLSREESLDPAALRGSYAGALGLPQFIPSSYRRLAVDFDGDGRRDLLDNPADAIGSVANYLARSGWKPGESVAVPARLRGDQYRTLLQRGLKPSMAVGDLSSIGVSAVQVAQAESAALLSLEGEGGTEFWLGFENFYAITRYNRSPLYAMAVRDLAEEVLDQYLQPARDLPGVQSAQTAKLQRLLRDRGFDPGPIDGQRGPQTDAALISFRGKVASGAGVHGDAALVEALLMGPS